jgi:glycine/D-amino acid oxidase-like deaminating enzyme
MRNLTWSQLLVRICTRQQPFPKWDCSDAEQAVYSELRVILDGKETDQDNLRGGCPPWDNGPSAHFQQNVTENFRCEVLVVGAGITGSLVAEHLAAEGHQVCIIDRERPGYGSTAASTAMLQWEIDKSLRDLAISYGFDAAGDVYRRSLAAAGGLVDLILARGFNCGLRQRSSLYLTAADVGEKELSEEHRLRQRAGLPGELLDHRRLLGEFGIDREAAILSPGSAEADPVLLSASLLTSALSHGARLFNADACAYGQSRQAVFVELDNGFYIEAKHVVLATGYVMPDFVKTDLHKVSSSWAIATSPQAPDSLWNNGALIWEASKRYHYVRTTIENRIIIGGEDNDAIVEPDARDALMPSKAVKLSETLKALWPRANSKPEFIWSGAFGTTGDGLPLIGPVPNHARIHAAYGYGGNGITFSYLASRMIAASMAGNRRKWFDMFAIDRESSNYI